MAIVPVHLSVFDDIIGFCVVRLSKGKNPMLYVLHYRVAFALIPMGYNFVLDRAVFAKQFCDYFLSRKQGKCGKITFLI